MMTFVCPDSVTCRIHKVCGEFITLEVNGRSVIWEKDFASTMIKQYHDHGIPYRIRRNCSHPDWLDKKYSMAWYAAGA